MDLTSRQEQKLKKATKDNIDRYPLRGAEVQAKVVKVHDGDTCDLAFYIGSEIKRFKCRLAEIDATELGEEDDKGRDGEIGRDFLAWLSIGEKPNTFPDDADAWTKEELQEHLDESRNLVYATLGDFGMYGRLLVTIKGSKHARKSFNELLVEHGYATDEE